VEHGAWLKAKLYPERCALSADGKLLATFVLDTRPGSWGSYFAVSKAPWLHALAAWGTVGTWTTGSHFDDDGGLVLAGACCSGPVHGSYPRGVSFQGVDTYWVRGRLFRELHTGWRVVDPETPWVDELPAPLAAHASALVIAKPSPRSAHRELVLVSLWEGHREYYLRAKGELKPILDAVWAEWRGPNSTELLLATRSGHLQVADDPAMPSWEYDMGGLVPEPVAVPEWARSW
jgi:hypothetical protein